MHASPALQAVLTAVANESDWGTLLGGLSPEEHHHALNLIGYSTRWHHQVIPGCPHCRLASPLVIKP